MTGKPIIVFSHPVLKGGAFAGLVFYSVHFDTMVKMVKATSYGDTGRFYIIDRVGVNIQSEANENSAPWSLPERIVDLLSDEGLHRYTGLDGKAVLGSATSITKKNFLIVAEMDEWENLRPFVGKRLDHPAVLPPACSSPSSGCPSEATGR